jgi:hypothetical protein
MNNTYISSTREDYYASGSGDDYDDGKAILLDWRKVLCFPSEDERYSRKVAKSVSKYRRGVPSESSSGAGPMTRSAGRLWSDATEIRDRVELTRTRWSTLLYRPLLKI